MRKAVLARPNPLQLRVVAIGEERPVGLLIDRKQDVDAGLAKIEIGRDPPGKGRIGLGQLAKFRA